MSSSRPNPHILPGGLSPDSIDVLSELYTILSRLRYTDKTGAAADGDSDPSKPGTNTLVAGHGGVAGSTPAAGAHPPADGSDSNSLSTKDLAAATDSLKHKIQRARAAVHTLPGIRTTIVEQQAEIREWEEKIRRQRAVLLHLKEFGLRFSLGNADLEMDGTGARCRASSA